MIRVGAIDCGTNSIRLLIADVDKESGSLTDLVRRVEIVRLGHGVDKTGVIAPEAMTRTLAQAREYASQCLELGVERVRFVATSASRDASNAQDFVAGVREAFAAFGIAPEVITGHEEASLSFRGATGDLQADAIPGPYLVVDIGGGSTEFVRGTDQVKQALSVDVGCVRMTERHLRSDPPTSSQIAAATADIEEAIDRAAEVVDFQGISALVALGRVGHDCHRSRAAADVVRPREDSPLAAASGPDHRRMYLDAVDDPCRAGPPWGSCTRVVST